MVITKLVDPQKINTTICLESSMGLTIGEVNFLKRKQTSFTLSTPGSRLNELTRFVFVKFESH